MSHNIYFAYGSNLHLRQMAKCCPKSRLLGIARLRGFRWQINERGYANVVAHDGSFVDGICYLLDSEDEASLDVNEGVKFGAYEKGILDVEVICQPAALVGRDIVQIVDDGSLATRTTTTPNTERGNGYPTMITDRHLDSQLGSAKDCSSMLGSKLGQGKIGEIVQALVYLSTSFTTDDYPADEYIGRMNMGLDDAIAMGISRTFIDSVIRTCLQPRDKYEST